MTPFNLTIKERVRENLRISIPYPGSHEQGIEPMRPGTLSTYLFFTAHCILIDFSLQCLVRGILESLEWYFFYILIIIYYYFYSIITVILLIITMF